MMRRSHVPAPLYHPSLADAVKAAGISVVSVGEAFLKTAEPGKVVEALLS